jgi:hypothetical protein
MITDTIYHGEPYTFAVTAQDGNGNTVDISGDWTASVRVVADRINGPVVLTLALDLVTAANNTVDTRLAPWAAGTYYYDCCFTDDAGNDYWSPKVRLVLEPRITPASA